MDHHFKICARYLPFFALLFAYLVYGEQNYYIKPSPDEHCLQDSTCLTLSQFAANASSYFGHTWMSISLFFLPGVHTLDKVLTLTHGDNLSLTKIADLNETVYVECVNESGSLHISDTMSCSIKGLNFIDCGENTVTKVDQLLNPVVHQRLPLHT